MALINENRTYVSRRLLRRFVPRVEDVAERHAAHPVVKLAATTAVRTGGHFAEKHDGREAAENRRVFIMREAQGLTARVEDGLRAWIPLLAGTLPFQPSTFTPSSPRPDDVLVAARRFVAFVDAHGDALPAETKEAFGGLRASVEVAEAKWSQARAALIDVQTRSQEARDAATAFHGALVVLRRVIASVLGRKHLDYQALRYSRAAADEAPVEIIDDGETDTPDTSEGERESGEFTAVDVKEVAS